MRKCSLIDSTSSTTKNKTHTHTRGGGGAKMAQHTEQSIPPIQQKPDFA